MENTAREPDNGIGTSDHPAKALRDKTIQESKPQKAPAQKEKPRKKGTPSVQKEIRRLEREIGELEARLASIGEERETHASDYEKLLELDAREAGIKAEIDEKYQLWDELSD